MTQLHTRTIQLVASLALVLFSPVLLADENYDRLIKRAAETYMPGVDWRLWKAQIKQESQFNCNAVSPVGAQGCAQIMPGTMKDITRLSGITGSAFDPEIGIMAGAFYMARQRAIFKAPRPEHARHNLAMGAYNAGAGNIIKAQQIVNNHPEWEPVAAVLPQVTGKHAKETQDYVVKIRANFKRYLLSPN
jgi:soluble lytic murein transglycosylase-like protein